MVKLQSENITVWHIYAQLFISYKFLLHTLWLPLDNDHSEMIFLRIEKRNQSFPLEGLKKILLKILIIKKCFMHYNNISNIM